MKLVRAIVVILFCTSWLSAYAAVPKDSAIPKLSPLEAKISVSLQSLYPGAKIECDGPCAGAISKEEVAVEKLVIPSVQLESDSGEGLAYFKATQMTEAGEVLVRFRVYFHAWSELPMAKRRIQPRELLVEEDFKMEKVDLARGLARQYRGLLLTDVHAADKIEAKNSLIQGQWVLKTMIQKIPAARKGDHLKIVIRAGDLRLLTDGTAVTEANLGSAIEVLSRSTKKQLSGILQADGTVEVKL